MRKDTIDNICRNRNVKLKTREISNCVYFYKDAMDKFENDPRKNLLMEDQNSQND